MRNSSWTRRKQGLRSINRLTYTQRPLKTGSHDQKVSKGALYILRIFTRLPSIRIKTLMHDIQRWEWTFQNITCIWPVDSGLWAPPRAVSLNYPGNRNAVINLTANLRSWIDRSGLRRKSTVRLGQRRRPSFQWTTNLHYIDNAIFLSLFTHHSRTTTHLVVMCHSYFKP